MKEVIYQLVDGKLVPKPGNQRDAGRRYAAVADCASGKTYSESLRYRKNSLAMLNRQNGKLNDLLEKRANRSGSANTRSTARR